MGISFRWFKLAGLALAHAIGLSEREMPEPKRRYVCPKATCFLGHDTPGEARACTHGEDQGRGSS